MKPSHLTIAILFCLSLVASAQKNDMSYFDENWKPCEPELARFYSIKANTDSGHFRYDYYMATKKPQMIAHYRDQEEKIKHGPVQFFYPNNKLSVAGQYFENKPDGICLSFHPNGMMSDSANYYRGRLLGYSMSWYPDGMVKDSIFQRNNQTRSEVCWFQNGALASAGLYTENKKEGKWQYFYETGGLAKLAICQSDEEISVKYFDKNGEETNKYEPDKLPQFKNGHSDWQKYLTKNIYWPNLEFLNTNQAVVGVKFTIGTDGNVKDAFVKVPLHPEFDKIALKVIMNAKGWKPAIENNRPVEYSFEQKVTFFQPE